MGAPRSGGAEAGQLAGAACPLPLVPPAAPHARPSATPCWGSDARSLSGPFLASHARLCPPFCLLSVAGCPSKPCLLEQLVPSYLGRRWSPACSLRAPGSWHGRSRQSCPFLPMLLGDAVWAGLAVSHPSSSGKHFYQPLLASQPPPRLSLLPAGPWPPARSRRRSSLCG